MQGATQKFFSWLLVLPLIGLIFWGLSNAKLQEGHFVKSDGRGYYAYLPSLILDNNLKFERSKEWESKRFSSWYANDYLKTTETKKEVNKYFPGTAFLLVPFYGFAAQLGFENKTGYEYHFQYAVLLGGWTYLLLGMTFLIGFLRSYHINNRVIAVTLITGFFGTSLFHYTHFEPMMSHVYGFFAVSGFLFFARRLLTRHSISSSVFMGLFLGVAICIRPTHIIVLSVIPLLYFPRPIKEFFTFHMVQKLLPGFFAFSFLFAGLLAVLYAQTGQLSLMTYKGEGFYFLNPQFFEVLFGFRKGLFIYAPLLLVGVFSIFQKQHFSRISWWVTFITITYFISSWWNWYYGDSFGHRAFVDYYPLLLLPLASFYQKWGSRFPFLVSAAAFVLMALSLFQNWQYRNGILHPFEMNASRYTETFGKTNVQPMWQGGCDIPPYGNSKKAIDSYTINSPFKLFGQTEKENVVLQKEEGIHYYVSGDIQFSELDKGASKELFIVFQTNDPKHWMAHALKTCISDQKMKGIEKFCFEIPKGFQGQMVEYSLWSKTGTVEIQRLQLTIEEIKWLNTCPIVYWHGAFYGQRL